MYACMSECMLPFLIVFMHELLFYVSINVHNCICMYAYMLAWFYVYIHN